MVLDCQLEVRERDGNERGNDEEDAEHDEHDVVDRKVLVAPHACEDVVEFDVDRAEGEEPCDRHLGDGTAEPGQRRDLARVLGRAARRRELDLHTREQMSQYLDTPTRGLVQGEGSGIKDTDAGGAQQEGCSGQRGRG